MSECVFQCEPCAHYHILIQTVHTALQIRLSNQSQPPIPHIHTTYTHAHPITMYLDCMQRLRYANKPVDTWVLHSHACAFKTTQEFTERHNEETH